MFFKVLHYRVRVSSTLNISLQPSIAIVLGLLHTHKLLTLYLVPTTEGSNVFDQQPSCTILKLKGKTTYQATYEIHFIFFSFLIYWNLVFF